MKIKQAMNSKANTIEKNCTVKQAAEKMKQLDCGALPVGCKEKDKLIGMITDRDIAMRCVAEGKDPNKCKVSDIMTEAVYYCYEDDDVQRATDSMKQMGVRRIVVVNGDKRYTGSITVDNIAEDCDKGTMTCDVVTEVSDHPHKKAA